MKNSLSLLLAALLSGSAASVRAAALPGENVRYVAADKALDAVAAKAAEIKKCAAYADSLQTQYAEKKEEVAGDNNGVLPSAYDDYFAMKKDRISRVNAACAALGKDFTSLVGIARLQIRGIEPGSAPGVAKRRERLATLQSLANSAGKRRH